MSLKVHVVVLALSTSLSAQSFVVSHSATEGRQPRGVTVTDLDRNGHPDALWTTGNNHSLAVALADGAGGFLAPSTFPSTGLYPYDVVAADLDGDGAVDAVVVNRDSNDLAVFLGDGLGEFAPAASYLVGSGPRTVRLADFDGDDVLDAAVANFGSANITVLLGDGAGGFSSSANHSVSGSPFSLDTGDLDGDGRMDIVVTGRTANEVSVLLNLGGGGFSSPSTFAVPRPDDVVLTDLNGDGDLDAATVNTSNGSVYIMLGNGAGGFGSATGFATTGGGPVRIVAADIDGDGTIDLVTANGNNDLSLLLGDGAGGMAPAIAISTGAGNTVEAVAVGDTNRDGFPDLVVASRFNHQLRVLERDEALAVGLFAYGEGTRGCRGALGISAQDPVAGNANFAIRTTNGPVDGMYLMLWGGPSDVTGYDPFGVGLVLHLGPGLVESVIMSTDGEGNGHAPFSLAGPPSLQGLTFFAQGVTLSKENCGGASLPVASSRGLEITVQ